VSIRRNEQGTGKEHGHHVLTQSRWTGTRVAKKKGQLNPIRSVAEPIAEPIAEPVAEPITEPITVGPRRTRHPRPALLPPLLLLRLQAVAMLAMGPNVSVRMGVRRIPTRIIVAVCGTSQMGMISVLTDEKENSRE